MPLQLLLHPLDERYVGLLHTPVSHDMRGLRRGMLMTALGIGFRKDARGRSTNRLQGRYDKLLKAPQGQPWVWLLVELLAHQAVQALSINARKVFDFLLIEYASHRGLENGALYAPYDQLDKFGVSRRLIRAAFAELNAAGLVKCTSRGGKVDGVNVAATYRITAFPVVSQGAPPTNEWKNATAEDVHRARKRVAASQARRRFKPKGGSDGCIIVN